MRVRKILDERVVGGLAGESDRVALGFGAVAPAVEHGEYDWFWSFCHGKSGYKQGRGGAKRAVEEVDSRQLKVTAQNETSCVLLRNFKG